MDKKIASEFAIALVLLVAIIIGGSFFLQNQKALLDANDKTTQPIASPMAQSQQQAPVNKPEVETPAIAPGTPQDCTPHYYEGDVRVHGWSDPQDAVSDDGVIMRVAADDVEKMPIDQVTGNIQSEEFAVKIIDPTPVVKGELKKATAQDPALITIKGFAQVCQQTPLVSLQQATVAFKKS